MQKLVLQLNLSDTFCQLISFLITIQIFMYVANMKIMNYYNHINMQRIFFSVGI